MVNSSLSVITAMLFLGANVLLAVVGAAGSSERIAFSDQ